MTTRRQFLNRIGSIGGYGAVYLSMQALGLLASPQAFVAPPRLPGGSGAGKHVVVLGAGVAGLVSAYELARAGYRTTVLEARDRIGGRVWTVRGGDRIRQIGHPDQRSAYDEGNYFNAGAARIPTHHHGILGYARELKVPLEVMVNVNRSTNMDFSGNVSERQAVNDTRGRFAELLAKAIDRNALDAELTGVDREALKDYLGWWGDLDRTGVYKGSERSGYATLPGGYDQPGKRLDPLTLRQLSEHRYFGSGLVFEEIFDQQAPMLQPVGGMDRIADALYQAVKPSVRLSTPVLGIEPTGSSVRVLLKDGSAVDADYCICTLPVPYVSKLKAPFSGAKKAALASVRYSKAVKVAWQAPRFWEEEGIYGGLAWTNQPSELVWYPSGNWNAPTGTLVGAYAVGWLDGDASVSTFSKMSFEQRFAMSKAVIERLHPGRSKLLKDPLTVAWEQTEWSGGVGADWRAGQRKTDYVELCRPEDRVFFAGEHLSYIPYWQEGAVLSAHEAVKLLHTRVAASRLHEPQQERV